MNARHPPRATAPCQPAPVADTRMARRALLLQADALLHAAAASLERHQGVNAIHDARVQARRLRALLGFWERECQPLLYAQLRFDLRDVARTLAESREADVRRQLFAPLLRTIHGAHAQENQSFLAGLDQARAAARRRLRTALHDARWSERLEHIGRTLRDPALWAVASGTTGCLDDERQFARRLRRLHEALGRKHQHMKRLHALRIAVKKTRYLAEALTTLGMAVADGQLQALRQLQNKLGALHDSWQLQQWLETGSLNPQWRDLLSQAVSARFKQQQRSFDRLRRSLLRQRLFKPASPV